MLLATACAGPGTGDPTCDCASVEGAVTAERFDLPDHDREPMVVLLAPSNEASELRFEHITDIERLSDLRLVVANTGRHEIVYLDAGGRVLRVLRPGASEGWDPVGVLYVAVLPGDSLLVNDVRRDRLHLLTPNGELLRSFRPPFDLTADPRDHVRLVGVLDDGSSIFTHTRVIGSDRPNGVVRDSTEFVWCRPGFRDCASLGWFLADEVSLSRTREGLPRLDSVPGGVRRQAAIVGRSLIVTYGDGSSLLQTDVVTGERIAHPIVLPPTVHILADEQEHLWARSSCRREGHRIWWVLDLESRQCSTVGLPAGFSPHVIAKGYAVGRWEDGAGREVVAAVEW